MSKQTAPEILIHDASRAGLPAVTGCPFPSSQVPDGPFEALLTAPDGTRTRAQGVPLTPPTTAGVRWVELSFLAMAPGRAQARVVPAVEAAPIARETEQGVLLDNGPLRVRVSARGEPVSVSHRRGEDWRALGTLTPEAEIGSGRLHHPPAKERRRIALLRNGPLRAQVELTGTLAGADGRDSLTYRLTVEVWKDIPALRVDWMLMHLARGSAAFDVRRATLAGEWQVGARPVRRFVQCCHGTLYLPREVANPAPVALTADATCGPVHVADPAMLLDTAEYAPYLTPPTVMTEEWLGLCGAEASVFATLRDFAATRPNCIESRGRRLDYHLIPPGHATRWPQGRRKEQTLLLGFAAGDGTDSRAGTLAHLRALLPEGRALPTPETLRARRCFDMDTVLAHAPGRNVRLGALLNQFCRLDTPGDKWDLGDTPDAGYTLTYPATPNCLHRLPGAPEMPVRFDPAGRTLFPASAGQFVEPVWTNNEYDAIHTLATQVMRTGDPGPLTLLRWVARHTAEVDFVALSDDPVHHRATPFHSHWHNMKGAISSHFWTQGLLQYYALTGDRDALEVALALGDKIIEIDRSQARTWKFDREVGWALLSLVCLVEAGFDRFRAECDEIGEYLQGYDRAAFSGAVNLSAGRAGRSLERQMIDNAFGYASLVEAMDRWQKVTGRRDTAAWLRKLLRELKAETWNAVRDGEVPSLFSMVPQVMAIGYERTGDRDFLRAGMVTLDAFLMTLDPTLVYPEFWGHLKPSAMAYRSLCRFLGHADRLRMLGRLEFPALAERRRAARPRRRESLEPF
jgi:hypothetical protein